MKIAMILAGMVCVGASAVCAQDVTYSDAATASCVDAAKDVDAKRMCIGDSAQACMAATGFGETTAGMGECTHNEVKYWDGALNANYKALLAQAKSADAEMQELGSSAAKQAPALQDMQRAWIAYRDATCKFVVSQWGGGSGAGPASVNCVLQLTGEQALYLGNASLGY